jgi:hypothetical protein
MTITVNTPDGGVANFPDGTDTGTITSVMKAKFGGPSAAPHGALYNALFKEGTGGSAFASADEGVLPAARDYSLAALDDLTLGMGVPNALKGATAQAQSNLGPMGYVTSAALYGAGPGKFLGPAGRAIGGAGIGGVAAEGALAGGISGAAHGDNPLTSGLEGAVGGGILGGAAGKLGGLGARAGSVDPQAAIASTLKNKTDAYAALTKAPADPTQIDSVLGGVVNNLDPSVKTGMSPGLRSTINDIRDTVQGLDQANMGQVDSWQRQINAAARREAHPTDAIVAGQIDSGLNGLIQGGGAGDLQQAAQTAHQQYAMAQNLAEWQRKAEAGAPLGQAPLTEAENWYQGKPQYQDLVGLYQKSQSQQDPSWALGHMAGHALGTAGYALGGFPGSMIGEALGVLGVKPMIKGAFKGAKQNVTVKNIQQLYPQMTGIQPTGAQQGQVGDAIKNLMLGAAY